MNKPINHTLEYYLAHTKKEPLEHVTIWITLKNMLLQEKMQQIHGKFLEWQNSPTVADELLPRTGVEKSYYQRAQGSFLR